MGLYPACAGRNDTGIPGGEMDSGKRQERQTGTGGGKRRAKTENEYRKLQTANRNRASEAAERRMEPPEAQEAQKRQATLCSCPPAFFYCFVYFVTPL